MRRRYRYHAAKRFGSINKYLPMLYDGKCNILSRTNAGQFGYNAALPYALSELTSPVSGIPMRDQHISYNAMQQPDTIVENGYTATCS